MTSVMILVFTLSPFHSSQVTYHLALDMVFTFRSLSDMQDAADIIMTLDIIINLRRTGFFLRVVKLIEREILSKKIIRQVSTSGCTKYQRSV